MPVPYRKVDNELRQFGRRSVAYPSLSVGKILVEAQPGMGILKFSAVVRGKSDNYKTQIWFFDIDYSLEKSKKKDKIVVAKKAFYYDRPGLFSNKIKMKCECQDFRFRFEKELYDETGLIGRFRTYKRKTPPPPLGRPFVNPKELMGYCKHIYNLIKKLVSKKYIKR